MTIIFKPKIRPWSEALTEVHEILNNEQEQSNISVPYGLQLCDQFWNPEVFRIVVHVGTSSGASFVLHHGVGKNNKIDIWNLAKDKQQNKKENRWQELPTTIKFLHIVFVPKRWIYVAFCTELSLHVYSAKFGKISCTPTDRTILCLVYNDVTDELIAGVAGGLMTWRFPIGQTDALPPGEMITGSFTCDNWVRAIQIDAPSKQLIAVSNEAISMLDITSYKENCFFQKNKDCFFTTCVFYHPESYFITGDKQGSIKAWSTSVNSFPLVTQFLGHCGKITSLAIHPTEPLLVSSSLDRTIRIWNFDLCSQTYRLQTGEEVLGMGLMNAGDHLYYYSKHHVKTWHLNLFHSLFTSLSTRIRRLVRIKSPWYPARVLAYAEDGGIRLISPVHGYELTTLLPITTIASVIVDMAHDPRREKIYVVLGTREMVVFESDTNPCCAFQLWKPEVPDEGVCSLAMINTEFALSELDLPLCSGLLFAGLYNGQISLVAAEGAVMKENVQAHQGQVTYLRVSHCDHDAVDSLGSRDHLVSCGTDHVVRVWQVRHVKNAKIKIQQKTSVKLLHLPSDLVMAESTLCLTMDDYSVVMCKFNSANEFAPEFMTHTKDERHTGVINGLSSCPLLKLFATSSEDQSVKIWNFENQLLRELCFDDSLCGVCFANARGDLLVGFQLHISLVTLTNYLPLPYLERISTMHFDNDPFEGHVQFDRHLKFWYDPQVVPTMPLELVKRRAIEAPKRTESRKAKKKEKRVLVEQPADGLDKADVFQKRRQSRRLSTQVHVIMTLRRMSLRPAKQGHNTIIPDEGEEEKGDEGEGECVARTEKEEDVSPSGAKTTEVTGPAITRQYWPCAPDGFIPNSTIRSVLRPKTPPARFIPQLVRFVPKKLEPLPDMEPSLVEEEDSDSLLRGAEEGELALHSDDGSDADEELGPTERKRQRGHRPIRSRLTEPLPPPVRRMSLPERSSSLIQLVEEDDGEEGEEDEYEENERYEDLEGEEELDSDDQDFQELFDQVNEEEISDDNDWKENEWQWSRYEARENIGLQLTDDEESEESEEEKGDKPGAEPSELMFKVPTLTISQHQPSPDGPDLLTEIVTKSWYPTTAGGEIHLDDVVDHLTDTLEQSDPDVYLEACQDLVKIHRHLGLPNEHNDSVQEQLIRGTFNTRSTIRLAAVRTLGELEVDTEKALVSIIRRLIDESDDVIVEAKNSLNMLRGVTDLKDLSRLLMVTGVVNPYVTPRHDTVLVELADRMGRVMRSGRLTNEEIRDVSEDETSGRPGDENVPAKPKAKVKRPRMMRAPARSTLLKSSPRGICCSLESIPVTDTVRFHRALKKYTLGRKLLQKLPPFKHRSNVARMQTMSMTTRTTRKPGCACLTVEGLKLTSASSPELRHQPRLSEVFTQPIESKKSLLSSVVKRDGSSAILIPRVVSKKISHCRSLHNKAQVRQDQDDDDVTPVLPSVSIISTMTSSASIIESIGEELSETMKDNVQEKEKVEEPTERGQGTSTQGRGDSLPEVDRDREASFSVRDLVQVLGSGNPVCRAAVMSVLQKIRTNQITPRRVLKDGGKTEELFHAKELLQVLYILPGLAGQPTVTGPEFSCDQIQHARKLTEIIEHGELLSTKRLLEAVHVVCSVIEARDKKQGYEITRYNRRRLSAVYEYLEGLLKVTGVMPDSTEFRNLKKMKQMVKESMMENRQRLDSFCENRQHNDSSKGQPSLKGELKERCPALLHTRSTLIPDIRGEKLLHPWTTTTSSKSMPKLRRKLSVGKKVRKVEPVAAKTSSVQTGEDEQALSRSEGVKIAWKTSVLKHASREESNTQSTGKQIQLKLRPTRPTEKGSRDAFPLWRQNPGPPLSPLVNRRLRSVADNSRDPSVSWCSAVERMGRWNSVEALVGLLGGTSSSPEGALVQVIKRSAQGSATGSYTSLPPPPNTATPGNSSSCQDSPTLPPVGKNALTSEASGNRSGRSSASRAQSRDASLWPRDLTRDALLQELDGVHLPPLWQLGKLKTSVGVETRSD